MTSKPDSLQLLRQAGGRLLLLEGQFGVGVQVLVERQQRFDLRIDALLDGSAVRSRFAGDRLGAPVSERKSQQKGPSNGKERGIMDELPHGMCGTYRSYRGFGGRAASHFFYKAEND